MDVSCSLSALSQAGKLYSLLSHCRARLLVTEHACALANCNVPQAHVMLVQARATAQRALAASEPILHRYQRRGRLSLAALDAEAAMPGNADGGLPVWAIALNAVAAAGALLAARTCLQATSRRNRAALSYIVLHACRSRHRRICCNWLPALASSGAAVQACCLVQPQPALLWRLSGGASMPTLPHRIMAATPGRPARLTPV
jgi:hypothetical protein